MSANGATHTIHFPGWYDERGEWEAEAKGWLQGVTVAFADGPTYSLFFYDTVRLGQDLEAESQQGRPLIAEPGFVVLPEVTRKAICIAVDILVDRGYFESLSPLPGGADCNGQSPTATRPAPTT